MQTQVSTFALEFVKTRELEQRLETAESNLAQMARARTQAQEQLLALSTQSSMPMTLMSFQSSSPQQAQRYVRPS